MAKGRSKKSVADAGKREDSEGDQGASGSFSWPDLWKSVGDKLLTAVISTGSLVAFVAFAGSVVLWSRFFAVHAPPDQVVAAVPRTESVAVGAAMLLLFGFFGALAALAVYLVDRGGRATPGMSRAILAILSLEAAVAIWITGDSSAYAKAIASEVIALAFGLALWSTYVGGLIRLDKDKLRRLTNRVERSQRLKATPFWQRGNKPGVETGEVLGTIGLAILVGLYVFGAMRRFGVAANWIWIVTLATGGAIAAIAVGLACLRFNERQRRKAQEKAEQRKEAKARKRHREQTAGKARRLAVRVKAAWRARRPRCPVCGCLPCLCRAEREEPPESSEAQTQPPLFELTGWGAAVMVALAGVAVVVPSLILREWWLAASLTFVFVIGCGLWRIAGLRRDRFIFLGMAVFISVPLFGTLMQMARNLAEPQVQALALIRKADGPDEAIQGIYVTENSERVYFASVATEGCSNEVTPASGRLLWVPSEEVAAMSIGPLESVEDAGKTALEMAYALTPAIETPAGDHVSLTPREMRFQPQAAPTEGRLEDPGPAVRPNVGNGLSLDPESASPGEEVTLTMSDPNEDVEGFGSSREGRNVRLGGVKVDVAKETAGSAAGAEYIEVGSAPGGAEERFLRLSKEGAFVREDGEYVPLEGAGTMTGLGRYVKLEDPALRLVGDRSAPEAGDALYVRVDESGKRPRIAADAPTVVLAGGKFEGSSQVEETIELDGLPLYRQAWHESRIKFTVPEGAQSGVVTVECGQLAGSPLLRVSGPPTARISVRMRAHSQAVTLNSARSRDDDGERISRRWVVDGVRRGRRAKINARLPLRPRPYTVKLTVVDEAGNVDTASLRLLRLPHSLFDFGKSRPDGKSRKAIGRARKSLESAVAAATAVAIELDGHADSPGTESFNLDLSLQRDDAVRKQLMRNGNSDLSLPVEELAYGETCPLVPATGRQRRNRRVEVFVLDRGVTVKPARGCSPERVKRARWRPPAQSP